MYKIEVKGLEPMLRRLQERNLTVKPLDRAMRKSALDVEYEAKKSAPRWKNRIARAITHDLKYSGHGFATAAVIGPEKGPTNAYDYVMEFGRRAGSPMPPWKGPYSIEPWARAHGMDPFLLARSIGRKGIKPRRWLDRAGDRAEPKVRTNFSRAGQEIERNWAGK